MQILIEIVGWVGALLIFTAYVLVSTGRLTGRSAAFQWMNVAGSAGFIVNSGYHHALPNATLNVAWFAIGAYTLIRLAGARRA